MCILNALVIALVIILDTATKQLFSRGGCNKYWEDAPRLYPPFYLIASDRVTMAGYWTVADERFSTRQTGDVSIIRAALRSSTYDKRRGPEALEIMCNLIFTQNKRGRGRTERQRHKRGRRRMDGRLGQARPRRILGIFFSSHSKPSRCAWFHSLLWHLY